MTLNRVVVLLSPVFVGLAGFVTQAAARYMPGHPTVDKTELTAAFIAGATAGAVHVGQWVHGWQKHEKLQADAAATNLQIAAAARARGAGR